MRLLLLAVGKAKGSPEQVLFDHYAKRLPWALDVIEIEERRPLAGPERKAREAELLLAKLPKSAFLVALDPAGEALSSEAFAKKFSKWQECGRDLVFVIGGADGLGDAVLDRSDQKLSLGAMIWPHLLVRTLLAEQVWRAFSILTNHPYHRG
ncbi:MAG: 23S rRNA (pseudouridine(1915)-N(3))-methyltransferase RlmH [Alphaproteobacteria bacterium]|nr:23S rRNA (pseudouridine(1915)-N(3))-methyltransferase RlmH [Alphaproteobacteria bacterium]MBF0354547.1 23S rRNA (pseudouridine(1915)-N(3))-methyltransferase RlmH [Alphaproteobacteria bacterium]